MSQKQIFKSKNFSTSYDLNDKEQYFEYLYWEEHIKGKLTEHQVMLKYQKKFGEFPSFNSTFKMDWVDWWYENVGNYFDYQDTNDGETK